MGWVQRQRSGEEGEEKKRWTKMRPRAKTRWNGKKHFPDLNEPVGKILLIGGALFLTGEHSWRVLLQNMKIAFGYMRTFAK